MRVTFEGCLDESKKVVLFRNAIGGTFFGLLLFGLIYLVEAKSIAYFEVVAILAVYFAVIVMLLVYVIVINKHTFVRYQFYSKAKLRALSEEELRKYKDKNSDSILTVKEISYFQKNRDFYMRSPSYVFAMKKSVGLVLPYAVGIAFFLTLLISALWIVSNLM